MLCHAAALTHAALSGNSTFLQQPSFVPAPGQHLGSPGPTLSTPGSTPGLPTSTIPFQQHHVHPPMHGPFMQQQFASYQASAGFGFPAPPQQYPAHQGHLHAGQPTQQQQQQQHLLQQQQHQQQPLAQQQQQILQQQQQHWQAPGSSTQQQMQNLGSRTGGSRTGGSRTGVSGGSQSSSQHAAHRPAQRVASSGSLQGGAPSPQPGVHRDSSPRAESPAASLPVTTA